MELVVDTNELFSFFEDDPKVRKLVLHPDIKLFSPDFVLEEIDNLFGKIKRSAGIDDTKYVFILGALSGLVEIKPQDEYAEFIGKAKTMISDVDDVPFLALALKLDVGIWSDDEHFAEQSEVEVFTTEDLYKLFFG